MSGLVDFPHVHFGSVEKFDPWIGPLLVTGKKFHWGQDKANGTLMMTAVWETEGSTHLNEPATFQLSAWW